MNTKKTIKRILFFGLWLFIGSGMLMLLIAAMGKQKRATCKDVQVVINARNADDLFLDEKDVTRLLKSAAKGKLVGQPKNLFDLRQMEELLEDNVWVKEAQLYFDNEDVLHVTISERVPVARVFTSGNRSFYLDEHSQVMQLSDKVSMKLPVFTGFPEKKNLSRTDSLLLNDVNAIAGYINGNDFWAAQVEQVDIVSIAPAAWEFELVPLVGNHVIRIGNGKDLESKFSRLYTFYKQVLATSGFDRYKTIDVRFAGQVVGGKTDNPKVDSVQLRKSVETLLRQIKEAEAKAAEPVVAAAPTKNDSIQSSNTRTTGIARNVSNPTPTERPAAKPAASKPRTTERQQPKAVMPKR